MDRDDRGQWRETAAQRAWGEMSDKYRLLFGSGVGLDVLSDILHMCHFGASLDPDNRAMVAEYNVGVAILAKCGMLKMDNRGDIVRSLLGGVAATPPPQGKKK